MIIPEETFHQKTSQSYFVPSEGSYLPATIADMFTPGQRLEIPRFFVLNY